MSESTFRKLSAIRLLRHAIIDTLVAAEIDGIGENVFEARREDAWPEEGSFAVVYTDSFKLDDQRTSPKTYKVSGLVLVDVVCQETGDGVNDKLDIMTEKVIDVLQPMMPKEGFFGGLTKRFVVTEIENDLSALGEMTRGTQRISFATEFNVTYPLGGPVDYFLKANSTIKMGEGVGNKQEFTTVVQELPPTPEPDPEPGESDA